MNFHSCLPGRQAGLPAAGVAYSPAAGLRRTRIAEVIILQICYISEI